MSRGTNENGLVEMVPVYYAMKFTADIRYSRMTTVPWKWYWIIIMQWISSVTYVMLIIRTQIIWKLTVTYCRYPTRVIWRVISAGFFCPVPWFVWRLTRHRLPFDRWCIRLPISCRLMMTASIQSENSSWHKIWTPNRNTREIKRSSWSHRSDNDTSSYLVPSLKGVNINYGS